MATARAMEQVLRAEHDGETELQRARAQAVQTVERARDEARTLVNRALDRAAHWQRRHAAALAARIAAQRARAEADPGKQQADPAVLVRAVEHLAARLTGDEPDAAR